MAKTAAEFKKQITFATNFSIPSSAYANQANAILGIRDSGKTYTAMKAAEELLDSGIPIVVYDPVGVWKNLRVGQNGKKGYAVILAGGDETCDIIITPENAVSVITAAMKSRVPIIIDLFHKSLANKSKWIKIVQETLEVLFYNNREPMHIFIEEAAEFAPQRIQPQQSKVYSSVERIVRMGRNSSIGITLINQRAEELNKAVLELCDLVFLHKQVGKNSLTSISKWLQVRGIEKDKAGLEVMHISKLNQGECMVFQEDSLRKIKILPKNTFHPSPQKGKVATTSKLNTDISLFLKKLNAELDSPTKEKPAQVKKISSVTPVEVQEKVVSLQNENKLLLNQMSQLKKEHQSLCNKYNLAIADLSKMIEAEKSARSHITNAFGAIGSKERRLSVSLEPYNPPVLEHESVSKSPVLADKRQTDFSFQPDRSDTSRDDSRLPGKLKMAKGLSMYPEGIAKDSLAILCGMSPSSGTFGVYYRELRSSGLFQEIGGLLCPTHKCAAEAKSIPDLPSKREAVVYYWVNKVGGGMGRILDYVALYSGESVAAGDVARAVDMSMTSGTFGVYYRKLRKLGLISGSIQAGFKLSHSITFFK